MSNEVFNQIMIAFIIISFSVVAICLFMIAQHLQVIANILTKISSQYQTDLNHSFDASVGIVVLSQVAQRNSK